MAKKIKQVEVEDTDGNKYVLGPLLMQELGKSSYGLYRGSLLDFFRIPTPTTIRGYLKLRGCQPPYGIGWFVRYDDSGRRLNIGCRSFNIKETAKIRQWVLSFS